MSAPSAAAPSHASPEPSFGWVVIGRNEGQRLVACLDSLLHASTATIVYVDSGSSDGSVVAARSAGARVVELDMSRPFTAARARNAGFAALVEEAPGVTYVQFVDGDCLIDTDWPVRAVSLLNEHPDVAVVSGRLKERFPNASVFNQLCQFEWDGSAQFGQTMYCGGVAMMRVQAFNEVQGFDPQLIAGEEPELCVRLRTRQWKIWRLDESMALHDADMHGFGQWWRRVKRSGYAFAEGAALHGSTPQYHYVVQRRRALIWGAAIPMIIACAVWMWGWQALWLSAVYGLQVCRLTMKDVDRYPLRQRVVRSVFLVLGRFAEMQGVVRFHWGRWFGDRSAIIEHK